MAGEATGAGEAAVGIGVGMEGVEGMRAIPPPPLADASPSGGCGGLCCGPCCWGAAAFKGTAGDGDGDDVPAVLPLPLTAAATAVVFFVMLLLLLAVDAAMMGALLLVSAGPSFGSFGSTADCGA